MSRIFGATARAVVILHDHMWGKTPPTRRDRAAIERRIARRGADFLRVVLLDDAPLPEWAKAAGARTIGDAEIDGCVEAIVAAIAQQGGCTRADSMADTAAREAAADEHARGCARFLGTYRSAMARLREFERLGDEIAHRLAALEPEPDRAPVEIRRSPERCMVQLDGVALTVSWLRHRSDLASDGRLMIVQWAGTVHRGTARIPERAFAAAAASARVLREDVLVADGTGALTWCWRGEGSALRRFSSRDLAALCVDALVGALRERPDA